MGQSRFYDEESNKKSNETVLVVGGGSAGWMAAAALANMLREGVSIHLVESEEIGTVGVGEATIPALKKFNNQLGLKLPEFVRATGGSFKLGIDFVNWGRKGHRYFHPFGQIGFNFDLIPIEQYWIKLWLEGNAPPLDDMSMAWGPPLVDASRPFLADPRLAVPADRRTILRSISTQVATRITFASTRKRERSPATKARSWTSVKQDGKSGFVRSVRLADGRELKADLFIDCSGFRS